MTSTMAPATEHDRPHLEGSFNLRDFGLGYFDAMLRTMEESHGGGEGCLTEALIVDDAARGTLVG